MKKRFKELVGSLGRVLVALTSVLGVPPAPAAANVDETQTARDQQENVGAKIDAIRKAFEQKRLESQEAGLQQLPKFDQGDQPFNEFGNFVSWLDFQSFQDFHNFGEFNNN